MRISSIAAALFPLLGCALEIQPWFGDVLEVHSLTSHTYSRFDKVQGSRPRYDSLFQSHLIYEGLDFSPTAVWSIDADLQFADTTAASFNWRSAALQGRYLWLDDIIGDPVSFATGVSVRATSSASLRDVSCPYHGNVDLGVNFSIGKEYDVNDDWRFRIWAYGAVGHANRGSPWVQAVVALETNYDECHKWAIWADGSNGYGRHTHIDVSHFYGYAKYRQKSIDLGIRYGHKVGVWGTLRFEYIRRVLAKTCPQDVNNFVVSFLLPFSL